MFTRLRADGIPLVRFGGLHVMYGQWYRRVRPVTFRERT
jgi:hypothetical protein